LYRAAPGWNKKVHGPLHAIMGNYQDALSDLNKAVEINPEDPDFR